MSDEEVPKELQESKSILVEGTNPDINKSKILNDLLVNWGEFTKRVKKKSNKFFICKHFSIKKDDQLEVCFNVYKGSPPDYNLILDSLQELLPHYGIRIISPEIVEGDVNDGH